MFKNILAPVDGSATSNRGLKQAVQLARDASAKVIIVHVVDEGALYRSASMEYGVYYINEMIDDLVKSGKQVLARALQFARKRGVRAQSVLVEDVSQPVADAIVKQARKSRADLIVIGTHGRRGLSRMVMGSDAESVVRQASVPVMLVRAPSTTKTRTSRPRPRRVRATQ